MQWEPPTRSIGTARDLFEAIDDDRDGLISFDQLHRFWTQNIGQSEHSADILRSAEEMFKALEVGGFCGPDGLSAIVQKLSAATWAPATDPGTGRVYYINCETDAVQWMEPGKVEADAWLQFLFNGDGRPPPHEELYGTYDADGPPPPPPPPLTQTPTPDTRYDLPN